MKQFILIIFLICSFSSVMAQTTDAQTEQGEDNDNTPDFRCDYSFLFNLDCKNTEEIRQAEQVEPTADDNLRNLATIEASLKLRQQELDNRKNLLDKKEQEIRGIELRIERKIDELKALLDEDRKERLRIEKLNETKFNSLIDLYSKSEPENASTFFNGLDVQTASSILIRLKPRIAAAIFEGLDPEKAVAITKHISVLKSQQSEAATPENQAN